MSAENSGNWGFNILDKAIAAAAAILVLLELDKLELTKRLKNRLQILLGDVEVDVAHVETVEGDGVGMGSRRFRVASLAVLLGLCHLNDDRNS